jgi:beta-glucosidase
VVLASLASAPAGSAQADCPWLNQQLPIDQRVSELIGNMTLQQEISLMQLEPGFSPSAGPFAGYESYVAPIPSLCIPAMVQEDGPAGVDGGITSVTQLPAPIAAASTFDRSLLRQYGATIGSEERAKGIDEALAPTLNLVRVPEWGRAFETLGEDPFLTSQLGDADIEGIQSQGVVAIAKHYVEYNQESGRLPAQPGENAVVSVRTMQETEMSVFDSAIQDAHVGGIMCAFPMVNGTFNCQDQYLLTTVLRNQFGFKGLIRADNPPPITSDVAAANAGLDQTRPPFFDPSNLLSDVQSGLISPATIQAAATAILYPLFEVGVFNSPPSGSITANASIPPHVAFALGAAEEGTVLLRNQANLLPLTTKKLRSIAVIGADAGTNPRSVGGGSASVFSNQVVTPLAGIQARAGPRVQVTYAIGNQPNAAPNQPGGLQQAVTAARYARVAIVFVGRPQGEGSDLAALNLSLVDGQLIRAVSRVNKHTIVVLNTGSPAFMPWLGHVQAVIEAWYPGVEDGNAIAAVLFGDVNPSGKLPVTFPTPQNPGLSGGQARWPGLSGNINYAEQLKIGYRWFDAYGQKPLFPFGFGLSYTHFSFRGLQISPVTTNAFDPNNHPNQIVAVVRAQVTNTGKRPGAEVAQLYLADPRATGEPVRQLRGFARAQLAPRQSTTVTFPLTARDLAYWRTPANSWAIARGIYHVYVGDSSALVDLPLHGAFSLGQ